MQRILQLAIVSRTLAPRDEEITPEGSDPMAGGDPEAEPKVRQRHAVFCFETVDVGLLEQPAMNEVLNHLLHLLSEGVRITELVLEHVFMTQLRFSVAGSFFREMLGVCSARGRGLKRFEYSCGDFERDTIGAVCSALALSQTISEFAFTESGTGRGADRSAWWPWLAYALFSQDAKNEIESVWLNVHDFTMQDMDAIRVAARAYAQ